MFWLEDIDPLLDVRRGIRSWFVTRQSAQIARIDADRFQLLPDGAEVELQRAVPRDLQRMRELIAAHLGHPQPRVLDTQDLLGAAADPTRKDRPPQPPPEAPVRRAPDEREVERGVALLREHGINAWPAEGASGLMTTRGEVPFTTRTKSAESAVNRWLKDLAVTDAATVREMVLERLAPDPGLDMRNKKGGVIVLYRGAAIATVNRYFVSGSRIPNQRVDLLADARPLESVVAGVRETIAANKIRAMNRPAAPAVPRMLLPPPRVVKPPTPAARPKPVPPPPLRLAPGATSASRQTWRRLPAEAPPHMVQAAEEATARLRRDRRLELAVTVEVVTNTGTLVFQKLRRRAGELVAEFTFAGTRKEQFSGGLILDGGDTLIRCEAPTSADRLLVATAWAAALVVYADLTCTDIVPASHQSSNRVGHAAMGAGRASNNASRRATSWSTGGTPKLGTVRSLAEAIDRLQSVSGFVRRLPAGQAPSADAIAAATAVGIRLPPGFTWVRPHVRSSEVLRVSLTTRKLW